MKENIEILIVEDSKTQAEELKYFLETNNFKVQHANDGEEAFAMLKQNVPDIIISDVVMPKIDGYELCKRIKSDENLKMIPIILLTALSGPKEIFKSLECGADSFVIKPYSEDFLISKVKDIFRNVESREDQIPESSFEIVFGDQKYLINSTRLQTIDLLLSANENAVTKSRELDKTNKELVLTQHKLNKLNENLEEEVNARTQRIDHLNMVLRAIRNVNQLIVQEKDRKTLIKKTCKNFVEVRNFQSAWIALLDDEGKIFDIADEGFSKDLPKSDEKFLRDYIPYCLKEALKTDDVVLIENIESDCKDCPWLKLHKESERGAMSVGLKSGGKCYGVINVSLPAHYVTDKEYQSLFMEAAGDIAHALYSMELEEKRKQAEKALYRSRTLLNATGRMAKVGGWELDAETLEIRWTEETYRIHEVPLDYKPLIDKAINFYHSEDRPKLEHAIRRAFEHGAPYDMELRFITAKGKHLWTHSICKPRIVDGKTVKLIGTFQDITERKQAEEALRDSEKKIRNLMESVPIGISISTSEGGVPEINTAVWKIFGYDSKEEFVKIPSETHYYDPKDRDQFVELHKKGLVKDFEVRFKRKDGTVFWGSVTSTTQTSEAGTTEFINVFDDITERKKLEEQFRQAQKMEAIGTLAGGVAHDFNNLLTVIIGNAQLALMDDIKDESLRIGIEETKKAGERAASLTRQLLAFSRKQVIQPEVLDFNELLTSIEKMLARLIGEDIELLTIPEPALWQVEVDPGQMEQVIMNLAVNARDAMYVCADSAAGRPTGGKLTIETANIDLDESYFHKHGIEKKKPDHYVMLTVSDTGSGMDKETQEHIFEPFFTTKEVGKGTGLGLSTVYGIIKQNNGFIWVYSEPGQGTTFKVYLPRVEGNVEAEEKEQTPVVELVGSETILIVEDDEGLRKFAQNALQQHGYKVLDAENGEEALKAGKEHEGPIHLMITDVVMPKMGGKEAAERLQPLYPRMKVIYMSGYTDNAIVQHGVLAPGLNFLEKPFTPESLARKVRKLLNHGIVD